MRAKTFPRLLYAGAVSPISLRSSSAAWCASSDFYDSLGHASTDRVTWKPACPRLELQPDGRLQRARSGEFFEALREFMKEGHARSEGLTAEELGAYFNGARLHHRPASAFMRTHVARSTQALRPLDGMESSERRAGTTTTSLPHHRRAACKELAGPSPAPAEPHRPR